MRDRKVSKILPSTHSIWEINPHIINLLQKFHFATYALTDDTVK